jgi:hypothetical protein
MMQPPERIYYWLVCKLCHNLHSADDVSSNPEELMRKSRKYECPNTPGQYAEYNLSDLRKGTLEDARKFSR